MSTVMDEETARRAAAAFLGGPVAEPAWTSRRVDPLGWYLARTGTRSNRGIVVADSGRVASFGLSRLTPKEALARISTPGGESPQENALG